MTTHLQRHQADRRRVAVGRAWLSFDEGTAVDQLIDTYGGPIGARHHIERMGAKLRARVTPTTDVIALAEVPALAERLAHWPAGSTQQLEILVDIEARVAAITAAFVDGGR